MLSPNCMDDWIKQKNETPVKKLNLQAKSITFLLHNMRMNAYLSIFYPQNLTQEKLCHT